MNDDFLAILARRLRMPLNRIIGISHLLLEEGHEFAPVEQQGYVRLIMDEALSQLRLVEDIIECARTQSGARRIYPRAVALDQTLPVIVQLLQPDCLAKDLHLIVNVADGLSPVLVDPGRLQQILHHLLHNAIRFTARGGHITVTASAGSPRELAIAVEDSGIGINPQDLPLIFDKFWQAEPASTRQNGGLGLGLTIAKSLVEQHGGTIRVASQEGRGTTITFTLPLARPGQRSPETHSSYGLSDQAPGGHN